MSLDDTRGRSFHPPAMPTASGTECVRVLVSLGWMPVSWTPRECNLQKGDLALTVPLDPVLSSTQMEALVAVTGLSPYGFVEALEKIRTGPRLAQR